jgi:hypothetical protein
MKRRDVLKGAAATAVLPVGALAGAAEKPDYEKKYWEAQRHIDELEEELRERRKVQVMDFDTMGRRPFYAEWDGESLSVLEYK